MRRVITTLIILSCSIALAWGQDFTIVPQTHANLILYSQQDCSEHSSGESAGESRPERPYPIVNQRKNVSLQVK
jgi:hypothetical protein